MFDDTEVYFVFTDFDWWHRHVFVLLPVQKGVNFCKIERAEKRARYLRSSARIFCCAARLTSLHSEIAADVR